MKLFLGEKCWGKIIELPKNIQFKVRDFQQKFIENPYSHAINLEKIATFKDSNLRTARIDDAYRAIIGVAGDDSFCLLWVDHHDEAMRWAQNKQFFWNTYTNSFQITSVVMDEVKQASPSVVSDGPYSKYSDDQLLRIGVPEHQLSLVKNLKGIDDLEKVEEDLPEDVFENLFYLLDDDTDINSIITEVEAGREVSGNTSINNKRSFIEISNDEELENVIKEGTEKWQIFLHPSQRLLVDKDYPGSMKVSGGGGTGKTVAALHRLKKLTDTASPKSVLYTTFTKTLIKNLSERIKALGIRTENCDIVNIDKLVLDLAKKYNLIADKATILDYSTTSRTSEELWEDVVADSVSSFDASFMYKEYLDVIVYNNVKTLDDYFRTSRVGRSTPVTRKQRAEIWRLVEQYIGMKKESDLYDRNEIFNLVANYLNDNNIRPYKNVIADEIQDFSNPELRFLRSLVEDGPNDLFLVGDPYQRIYNNRKIAFSQVGINVRGKRSKRLRVNYRTTEEIKKAAVNVVNGCSFDDFDGSPESLAGYVSLLHGDTPEYKVFSTKDDELDAIISFVNSCRDCGIDYKDIVIACDSRNAIKTIQNVLHRNSLPYINLFSETGGDTHGIHLSTFHNMKGLEFKVVVLADVSKNTFPRIPIGFEDLDPVEKKNHLMNQKALMYVAITRAMQKVLITGTGEKAEI